MANEVFISYASPDKPTADRVCAALESAEISCWMAPRNIEPGKDFPSAIVEAVQSARVLVLVLTAHAAGSPHILSEVGHAFNGKKPIIPFRLSVGPLPEDLEYFLSMTQWLDAPEGCTEPNLRRLTQATSDALRGERASRHPDASRRRKRWRFAAIAAPALAAAAGTILYLSSLKSPDRNPAARESSAVTPPASSSAAGPSSLTIPPVKIQVNPVDGQSYVWVPPGRFTMGCSVADSECQENEKPAHPVEIDRGFWLGQTEVTIAAYGRYANQHALKAPDGNGSFPVSGVTWAAAKDYCAGIGGRLPTEAEWEYAARGGDPQSYYGVVRKIAWYVGNSDGTPHPVGKKQPNAFGLYDMLGNVAEWVLDRYFNRYDLDSPATAAEVEQPLPLGSNHLAIARGGFWGSEAASVRVSHRVARENDQADPTIGFRCATDHL